MKYRYKFPYFLILLFGTICVIVFFNSEKEVPNLGITFFILGIIGFVLKSKNIYLKKIELFLVFLYFNVVSLLSIIGYLLL